MWPTEKPAFSYRLGEGDARLGGVMERLGVLVMQPRDHNSGAGTCRAIVSAARVEPPHSPGHNRRQGP